VREAAAKALATALPSKPDLFEVYLSKFTGLYHEKVFPYAIATYSVGETGTTAV